MTTTDAKGPVWYTLHEYDAEKHGHTQTLYVRADLYDAMKQERDTLYEHREELRVHLDDCEKERDRYREAIDYANDCTLVLIAEHKLGRDGIMKRLRNKLREAINPQEHGGGGYTVEQYIDEEIPPRE